MQKGTTILNKFGCGLLNRIVPHRIKYHPGVTLEVVLSTSDGNGPTTDSRNRDVTSTLKDENDIVDSLMIAQEPADTSKNDGRTIALLKSSAPPTMNSVPTETLLPFKQTKEAAQKTLIESEIEQQLVASLPSEIQVQIRASMNIHDSLIQVIKDGLVLQPNEQLIACLRKLDDKMIENNELASKVMGMVSKIDDLASKNNEVASENKELMARMIELQESLDSRQDEMKHLQMQALDRLALLQNSVTALLTQTYELHEYPIPRLFVLLPADNSPWNPMDLLSNKFRLHFLCECGEHTKSVNSKIPHHIHLAKHEGYDITHPNEFFQQYGSYILTIIKMLRFGISTASVHVPAVSSLVGGDGVTKVSSGLDKAIDFIERVSADDEDKAVSRLSKQMKNNEALEGANLRQLELFLKIKDTNRTLGNLFRTVTAEGHVKWVCIDHYRENHHEKTAKAFRNTVEVLRGRFDESTGRVDVTLRSRVQAEQFYAALEKMGSIYELKAELGWDTTQSDLRKLRDTLALTHVGVLELHLKQPSTTVWDFMSRGQLFDPILDIMRNPSIKSFTIRGPQDFSTRSSLLSRDDDFSNLRHLDISLKELKGDMPAVMHLITKAPNLSSLAMETGRLDKNIKYVLEVCNALSEHRSYPVTFKERRHGLPLKDWKFTVPPPPKGSDRLTTVYQCMDALLKVFCESASDTVFVDNLDALTLDALAKATTTKGSEFRMLYLYRDGELGDPFVDNISSVVARSKIQTVDMRMRQDKGRVRILESIQWQYLRNFLVYMDSGTFEISIMRVLLGGVKKMSGHLSSLKNIWFLSDSDAPLTLDQGNLQALIAATSIEELALQVAMTLEQMISLLRSVDVSQLKSLTLWAKGFDSVKVGAILDSLRHATKLEELFLHGANATNEQKQRMAAKGIMYGNAWFSE